MGAVKIQHQELAEGRWAKLPLALQIGNIGSEVSRSLKWYKKNEKRFQVSFERALELFDLSIQGLPRSEKGKLRELCRAREEFCDYFLGGNSWQTDPQRMMRYYDQFVGLVRKL